MGHISLHKWNTFTLQIPGSVQEDDVSGDAGSLLPPMEMGNQPPQLWTGTYITLNLHGIPGVFHVQGVRQEGVVVVGLSVVGVGGNFLRLLCSGHTEHIQRCVVPGLAGLVSLLILTIWLYFGHIHVVNQFRVVLKTEKANLLAFGFFIGLLVFALFGREGQTEVWYKLNLFNNLYKGQVQSEYR